MPLELPLLHAENLELEIFLGETCAGICEQLLRGPTRRSLYLSTKVLPALALSIAWPASGRSFI